MGQVSISINGSFGKVVNQSFSAEHGGHVMALNRAISILVAEIPGAVRLDHQLHSEGQHPSRADFGMTQESSAR